MNLEAYTQVDESAKIQGVALIPRISRNNNLYTKAELERFDNVQVPLNWEHDPTKKIGTATFHFDPTSETVFYDGEITNEGAASLAKNKTLFTSIEADPISMQEICNSPGDCFSMPFGLTPKGLALTESPGVPETTVHVIEHYIEECGHHPLERGQRFEVNDDCVSNKMKKMKDEPKSQDQKVAIAISKCRGETLEHLKDLGLLEALDLEYCDECGKLKKKNR